MLTPEPRANPIALGLVLVMIGLVMAAMVWVGSRSLNPNAPSSFGPGWRCETAPRAHLCYRVDASTAKREPPRAEPARR